MSLIELRDKIEKKEARLAVIGLGYVGLPVACQFAKAGFLVLGVEILSSRVQQINHGISPIEGNEPGLSELIFEVVKAGNLRSTDDYQELHGCDVILIDVETPVDEQNIPRYDALKQVVQQLSKVIKPGVLIIVESTIAPGTIDNLVLPLLIESSEGELNRDFYLGHCPERVMPGKLLANLQNVSRVVGGMTPETANTMVALYRHIVQADLDPVDCVTAELVKTTENAYRDVQIAFANEVALICEAVGGDVWKVRELVNKSPYRNMHLPGAGVGGHCIPKDPWLLAYAVNGTDLPLRLIPAARNINDTMPFHVIDILWKALEVHQRNIEDSSILVMGYAYLEDSDDTRNSPSKILVEKLQQLGAKLKIHDPYVPGFQGDLLQMAEGCDGAVLMVRHNEYRIVDLERLATRLRTPIMIDARRMYTTGQAETAGFHYFGLGIGIPR